jgi:hypothetical protein
MGPMMISLPEPMKAVIDVRVKMGYVAPQAMTAVP